MGALDFIKSENFDGVKYYQKREETKHRIGHIIIDYMSGKGIMSRIIKKLTVIKRKVIQLIFFKLAAKNLNTHFSKEDMQVPEKYMKVNTTSN